MQTAIHLFPHSRRFAVKIQMRVPRPNASPICCPAVGPQFMRRHAQKLSDNDFRSLMRIVQSKRAGGRRQTGPAGQKIPLRQDQAPTEPFWRKQRRTRPQAVPRMPGPAQRRRMPGLHAALKNRHELAKTARKLRYNRGFVARPTGIRNQPNDDFLKSADFFVLQFKAWRL